MGCFHCPGLSPGLVRFTQKLIAQKDRKRSTLHGDAQIDFVRVHNVMSCPARLC